MTTLSAKAKEDMATSLPCDLDQYKELIAFDVEVKAAEEADAKRECCARALVVPTCRGDSDVCYRAFPCLLHAWA